ncbi:MAG: gamma-glutamyltransferase [Methylococcales bacterium]|nr:gamma-glutamyltransferase [Methylococcales bacterium]
MAIPAYAESLKTAIASAHPLATEAGFEVLANGGNAFDAAVAVSAALAVVEPTGSGLGGGGFWLLHRAKDNFETMIDGREKAPIAATKNMYVNEQNNVIEDLSKEGALSAAIPGLPAAITHLAKKYGRLPLSESLAPAIRYATEGFAIGPHYLDLLTRRQKLIRKNKESTRILLTDGQLPLQGALLKQPDLAHTLQQIAAKGKAGFYQGETAKKLIQAVQEKGGIWTQADLDRYQIIERMPIYGYYKDIKVTSAALPSSGGIVLVEALNILSAYKLDTVTNIQKKHLITEAMRRAYHDRALYLGDSDFIQVPISQLLDHNYAAGLRSNIRIDRALPSNALSGEEEIKIKGEDTTHFSIIDTEGNRISATLSINFPFGSGVIAKGTGVILNNEMDDFVSLEGQQNGYGLIGGAANTIAPEKRMLSSMTPTFLESHDRIAVLGTPGGSRIISMILLSVLDFSEGNSPDSWVKIPRYHHQYIPDQILYEAGGLSEAEEKGLFALGHSLKERENTYGNMQAAELNKHKGKLKAASDPRGEGFSDVR